jgi:hypothetical protein
MEAAHSDTIIKPITRTNLLILIGPSPFFAGRWMWAIMPSIHLGCSPPGGLSALTRRAIRF